MRFWRSQLNWTDGQKFLRESRLYSSQLSVLLRSSNALHDVRSTPGTDQHICKRNVRTDVQRSAMSAREHGVATRLGQVRQFPLNLASSNALNAFPAFITDQVPLLVGRSVPPGSGY